MGLQRHLEEHRELGIREDADQEAIAGPQEKLQTMFKRRASSSSGAWGRDADDSSLDLGHARNKGGEMSFHLLALLVSYQSLKLG